MWLAHRSYCSNLLSSQYIGGLFFADIHTIRLFSAFDDSNPNRVGLYWPWIWDQYCWLSAWSFGNHIFGCWRHRNLAIPTHAEKTHAKKVRRE